MVDSLITTEAVYRRYLGYIRSIANRFLAASPTLRRRVSATDVAHNVLAKLPETLPQARQRSLTGIRSWIGAITRNELLSELRRARHSRSFEAQDLHPEAAGTRPGEQADALRDLWEAIGRLDERDRTLILLGLDGLAFRQIGERLNCSTTTAHQDYHRAVGRLRRQMGARP